MFNKESTGNSGGVYHHKPSIFAPLRPKSAQLSIQRWNALQDNVNPVLQGLCLPHPSQSTTKSHVSPNPADHGISTTNQAPNPFFGGMAAVQWQPTQYYVDDVVGSLGSGPSAALLDGKKLIKATLTLPHLPSVETNVLTSPSLAPNTHPFRHTSPAASVGSPSTDSGSTRSLSVDSGYFENHDLSPATTPPLSPVAEYATGHAHRISQQNSAHALLAINEEVEPSPVDDHTHRVVNWGTSIVNRAAGPLPELRALSNRRKQPVKKRAYTKRTTKDPGTVRARPSRAIPVSVSKKTRSSLDSKSRTLGNSSYARARPAERRMTQPTQVRRGKPTKAHFARWVGGLNTYEDYVHQGKEGARELKIIINLLKELLDYADEIPAEWFLTKERIGRRGAGEEDAWMDKRDLVKRIARGYRPYDDDKGQVLRYAKQLLEKWKERSSN